MRKNYLKMYAAYCLPQRFLLISPEAAEVATKLCSNESLKKVSSNTAAWMSRQPQDAQPQDAQPQAAQGTLPLPAVKKTRCARIFAKCP